MPGLFYFIPEGRPGIGLAELGRLGLGYAFESRSIATRQVSGGGPGGHGGLLLAAADRGGDQRLGYFADQQTWQKIVGVGNDEAQMTNDEFAPWAGFYTAEPPGPELLVRKAPLDGRPLALADGRPWVIPRARAFFEEDGELQWRYGLPHVSRLGEDGRWSTGKVAPRYADLWAIAERWESERLAGGEEDAEESESQEERYQRLHDTAAAVLRANYRLGRVEVSLLGLLSTVHVLQVLDELIDLPTRLEWLEKKTGPLGTGTGPGSAD